MNEHEEERQQAPITLRRSSQKGGGYGWTIAIPSDATEDQISLWTKLAWYADYQMRQLERHGDEIAEAANALAADEDFQAQLKATLDGLKNGGKW